MRREIARMVAAVGFTLSVLAVYCAWGYFEEKRRLIAQIDERLFSAASAVPYILKDDFHDRAIDPASISPEEDKTNILSLSALNNRLGMKFLYTVFRDRNGIYRLSSSSATGEELKTGNEVRYFTAYPDASDLLKKSFENRADFRGRAEDYSPIYAPVYSDRWGTYRSVFIPIRSPDGNLYVACADVDISYVTALLRHNLLQTILEFVIFALAILPILYTYVSVVKRKSREFQQVQQLYLDQSELTITDPLTRIGNRLKLDNELKVAMSHYQTVAQPFVLAMIDIDHFKSINDRYGHQVGDIVLQQFAELLVANSRSSDIVGRWGGEEFMIIYLNANLEGAFRHAEKLRNVIENARFEKNQNITASFGVAQPTQNMTLPRLLQCVDEALYTAKGEGRNRTVQRLCD